MTIKEAWEILSYYAYKADNEELANNHSEQDGDEYREAEAIIKKLVKDNS